MELVKRKRVEIVADAVLLRSIRSRLDELGVAGYTVLPVQGGRGDDGEWSREGQVSAASEMSMIVCLTSLERSDAVIESILPLLQRGRGVLSVSDVGVVRADKF